MKKTSRVLAILLALALIVGMVPFSTKDVSAATDESYMLEASGAATAGVPMRQHLRCRAVAWLSLQLL